MFADFLSYNFVEFISSTGFVCVRVCFSKGFPCTKSCYLQTEIILLLSGLDAFYFFCFPNCSGYDFQYVEYSNGESGLPCLVPYLRRRAFSFSALSMMFIVTFLICLIMLR